MSILEELMRGGELRNDPMDDDRGGAEKRKIDETEQGGEGAGRRRRRVRLVTHL